LIPECRDRSTERTVARRALHDGAWWANATKRFDFRKPDALDAAAFNRVLWHGVMGAGRPYPIATPADADDEIERH